MVNETTHQNLPPGFQTAEFMMEHGLVDFIVNRADMRDKLSLLLKFMLPQHTGQTGPVQPQLPLGAPKDGQEAA